MNTKKQIAVDYFYSYFRDTSTENISEFGLFAPKIFGKLPKLELKLPQLSICENLELSFC